MKILIPAVGLLLAGCLTIGKPPESSEEAVKAPPTKAQEQAEQAALSSLLLAVQEPKNSKENYRIAPSDLVEIKVFREDELNRSVRVNQDGEISFPFVGTIKIGGKSVIDAEKALATGLADYIRSPQVTIFIKEYSARQVYVLGEVKNPGAFPLPTEAGMTVLEAISLAGGFTAVAAQDRTRVIRNDPSGKPLNFIIPVSAITRAGQKDKDMPLVPSDVVFVPQSFF